MPAVAVDLTLSCRWIAPMTMRGLVLENHALVVRDGRILDVLPSAAAADRYVAATTVDRPRHLLLPGLVNARARLGHAGGAAAPGAGEAPRARVAAMLAAGTTCVSSSDTASAQAIHVALDLGMRAHIGIPIDDTGGSWALRLRDDYRGHPTITTAFALQTVADLSDATLERIATLAAELDTGILAALHESSGEMAACAARHGMRPIARLHARGLLTPALTAAHMVHVDASDIDLAQRSGIAVTLCPGADLRTGSGMAPFGAWAETGLRMSLGSGTDAWAAPDLWLDLQLLALLSRVHGTGGMTAAAWDALHAATRGGAAALGLEADIGTLEAAKWADLCCIDMAALPDDDVAAQLLCRGGRDLVSDAWVAGRHLVERGVLTRLD